MKLKQSQRSLLYSAFRDKFSTSHLGQSMGASMRAIINDAFKYYCFYGDVVLTRFQDRLFVKKEFELPVLKETFEIKVEFEKASFEALP